MHANTHLPLVFLAHEVALGTLLFTLRKNQQAGFQSDRSNSKTYRKSTFHHQPVQLVELAHNRLSLAHESSSVCEFPNDCFSSL